MWELFCRSFENHNQRIKCNKEFNYEQTFLIKFIRKPQIEKYLMMKSILNIALPSPIYRLKNQTEKWKRYEHQLNHSAKEITCTRNTFSIAPCSLITLELINAATSIHNKNMRINFCFSLCCHSPRQANSRLEWRWNSFRSTKKRSFSS